MKVLQSFCNACGRETDHETIHVDERETDEEQIISSTLICKGCREHSIKKEVYFHHDVPTFSPTPDSIEYIPPRLWHHPPVWLAQLEDVDSSLRSLLDEVYSTANSKQSRLLAMGIRTVLDKVMTQIVGDHSFEEKLKLMVIAGEISAKDKENLEIVIDAGSAASHRSYLPTQPLLQEMIATMESIVRKRYLTGPMLASMKERIPPRPTRTKVPTIPFQVLHMPTSPLNEQPIKKSNKRNK